MDLLQEIGKLGAKLVDIPIEQNDGLCSESGELLYDSHGYKRLGRKLIYLTITWPEYQLFYAFESINAYLEE